MNMPSVIRRAEQRVGRVDRLHRAVQPGARVARRPAHHAPNRADRIASARRPAPCRCDHRTQRWQRSGHRHAGWAAGEQ